MSTAQSHTILIDCNFYLHRAFNVSASRKSLDHLEKNTLTLFLQLVAADIVALKGTHALLCFDAPGCFRYEVYPDYKLARRQNKTPNKTTVKKFDGTEVVVSATPGGFVKAARKLVKAAGLTHAFKVGYEADDLLASAVVSLPGRKTVCTRDKDLAVLVSDTTKIYWPKEQKILTTKDVVDHWGVEPAQIRDYLCLVGDSVDSIPGVPNVGPVTARTILRDHGSIAKALKTKKWRPLLVANKSTLSIAKKLVTLRSDVVFDIEDVTIKDIDDALLSMVWEVPKSIKELGEARKASKLKGLFG